MKKKITINQIRDILSNYRPDYQHPPDGYRAASVLIPFYQQPEGLSLIFMKRPDYQGAHGDQISFPGGSQDESDEDAQFTALRETEEELGIDRQTIEIWGNLKSEFTNVSRFWITPFTGQVPYPCHFDPDEKEVERIIVIPFDHLADPENFAIDDFEWKGMRFPSYLFTYGEDVIWGLTARILFNLISLLEQGEESSSRWPPA